MANDFYLFLFLDLWRYCPVRCSQRAEVGLLIRIARRLKIGSCTRYDWRPFVFTLPGCDLLVLASLDLSIPYIAYRDKVREPKKDPIPAESIEVDIQSYAPQPQTKSHRRARISEWFNRAAASADVGATGWPVHTRKPRAGQYLLERVWRKRALPPVNRHG